MGVLLVFGVIGGYRWWPRISGVDVGVSGGGSAGSAQREATLSGVSRSEGSWAGSAHREEESVWGSLAFGVQVIVVMIRDP